MGMTPSQYWQNFELGKEIDVACGFLFDGLRNFRDLRDFREEADVFPVLYNLSVGLERLLKVAVVLLEFSDDTDARAFEASLITHDHGQLMARVRKRTPVRLDPVHNELVSLLTKFYKSHRYDRFSVSTVFDLGKDKKALLAYLRKHLRIPLEDDGFLHVPSNSERIRGFVGKILRHIVVQLYDVIRQAAREKNLYTFEVRPDGKAARLLFDEDFSMLADDMVWKELFVFVMTTRRRNDFMRFIKGIKPLGLDIAFLPDFIAALKTGVRSEVSEHVEAALDELEPAARAERALMLAVIGDPNVYF